MVPIAMKPFSTKQFNESKNSTRNFNIFELDKGFSQLNNLPKYGNLKKNTRMPLINID